MWGVRQLGYRLEEAIGESLGLEEDYIRNMLVNKATYGSKLLPTLFGAIVDLWTACTYEPHCSYNSSSKTRMWRVIKSLGAASTGSSAHAMMRSLVHQRPSRMRGLQPYTGTLTKSIGTF